MRRTTLENFDVLYPEAISFIFNPQKIIAVPAATNIAYAEFLIGLSGETPYIEKREPLDDGTLECDISQYLRLKKDFAVEKNGQQIKTSFGYDVMCRYYYSNRPGYDGFSFSGFAVFGAINIGEIFNVTPRKIKWFKNFPFDFSIYLSGVTALHTIIDDGTPMNQSSVTGGLLKINPNSLTPNAQQSARYLFGGAIVNTFNNIFSSTFRHNTAGGSFVIDLEINDCTKGIYLRWIDKHGFYNYYLFDNKTDSYKTANNGNAIELDFTDGKEFYNGFAIQNKTEQKEIKLAVPLADFNARQTLKSIFGSPLVEMFIGAIGSNDNTAFVPVVVAAGTYTSDNKPLQDVEVTITIPQQTQQF
jgi:hypothetical protein